VSVSTIAPTTAGRVQGMEKDGVVQFRGIPFAAPPIGALRFRAPQPPVPWHGTLETTRYGPLAPQNASPLESMLGASRRPISEDCLTLNVWTPALDDGGRPVMVWIHGGAYETGTGSIPWYDGASLARRGDVVVVTFNYRLGALGFLHLADLLGDEYADSGVVGTLDQIAALRWVQDNVAAFGGDPDDVTVFGESAGGMSVATLLGAPAARGLFRRAIPQSGAAMSVFEPDDASYVTKLFIDELGHDDVAAASLDEVLAAQQAAGLELLSQVEGTLHQRPGLPFRPVVGGELLPQPPQAAIAAGNAADVAVLTGTTADEWHLFALLERRAGGIDEARLLHRAERLFGPALGEGAGAHAVDVYRSTRPGAGADDIWGAIATDWIFRIPSIRLLEAQSTHQRSIFAYLFSFASTAFDGALGSCHAIEIPFVFDNLHRKGVDLFLGGLDDDVRALGRLTSDAWLSFARTGDPGWDAYDVDRRATMQLDRVSGVVDDPGRAERELWDGVL
jgi:para-nitrobenzyl esterase